MQAPPKQTTRFKKTAAWLLMASVLATTTVPAWSHDAGERVPVLPAMGDGSAMSTGEERELGDRIARELYRDPSAVDDPVLGEYLDSIWQRLLAAARQRGELPPSLDTRMAWRLVQIRDREVNAFALPGGYLGIQYGLIAATQDRNELATVIAHELSHVTQRHIARSIDQQARVSPLMLATMLVGAIAATRNPAAGQALMIGGQAAGIQHGLNFSRDMEREADRIGYAVMTQAGFAPEGAVHMFERLQAASRLNDSGAWPYLRTHPLTTERIGDMQSRQARLGKNLGNLPADIEHQMLAARARVLAETGIDNLRSWARLPQAAGFDSHPLPQRAGLLYQAAMAQAALRDWPQALATAQDLATLVAGDATAQRQARRLQADLAWRSGDAAATLSLLPDSRAPATTASASTESTPGRNRPLLTAADVLGADAVAQSSGLNTNPSDTGSATASHTPSVEGRTERLWRAMAQLKLGQAAAASSSLQAWVANHPGDALAWQTLSQAWEAQGQQLRALRAQAEARIAQSDWQGARDRLQAAQELSRKGSRSPGEHIEASIIDTRLQQATEKLRQQALDDARRR